MKRKRNTYFTSDWHVNHKSVLQFDNRPFGDLDQMHRGLVKRYNAIVRKEDVGYFLGDMGFCGSGFLKSIMDQLNGTKILILGNHDKKQQAMLNSGFDAVLNGASMYIAGELVTMTHCPLRGVFREDTKGMRDSDVTENWHREKDHDQFSIEDQGQFHLHGHTHAPNSGKSEVKLNRQWDVGVCGNNYRPISISEVESWIAKTKREEKW